MVRPSVCITVDQFVEIIPSWPNDICQSFSPEKCRDFIDGKDRRIGEENYTTGIIKKSRTFDHFDFLL